MQFTNTLTKKIEEFHPIEDGKVLMYACGPTVYNYIHIGNARPMVVFDCLRRYLEYRGFSVTFVQNFTDVDDKIIQKANEEGTSAAAIAERFIAEYKKDAAGLNVLPATLHPKVTESMDVILSLIQELINHQNAYVVNGDVYFDTKTFSEYGKLSHMPLEDLEAGSRVQVSDQKRNPLDFALWKAAKPSEPSWDSPWGKGRPGWHIECSAMAIHHLAPTIDIHCGGQDLIFPHHENEIAQSECATHQPFAHYWLHNGYINVDNRKMSKSPGNLVTVREVAEQLGYEAIRFLMLQAQYRSPINYSPDVIRQCVSALDRLYTFRDNLAFALTHAPDGELQSDDKKNLEEKKARFIQVMDDDFNTADGLSVIFELVRECNPYVTGKQPASKAFLLAIQSLFEEFLQVLGLLYERKGKEETEVPQKVKELFEQRVKAREEKNYSLADQLREQIAELGYLVEETRQGSKLKRKE